MNALLTSGEIARLNGVSGRAIRLYHSKGILNPAVVEESTGRRLYQLLQSEDLDMIGCLQLAGCTLDEIATVSDGCDLETYEHLLEEQLSKLLELQGRINAQTRHARRLLEGCRDTRIVPVTDQILIEKREPIDIVALKALPSDNLRLRDRERVELGRLAAKREIFEQKLPADSYFDLVMTLSPSEQAFNLEHASFALVRGASTEESSLGARERSNDKLSYLVVYLEEIYDGNETFLGNFSLGRLKDYASVCNLQMVGPLVVERLCVLPGGERNNDSNLYRLLVQVEKRAS